MKQPNFGRYLKYLALAVPCLILFILGFNWFVDPYGIYYSPRIERINSIKTQNESLLRMTKAHAIKQIRPKSIILGTSRALRGIDPDHAGWLNTPVYNLALPGANIYEVLRYFQHAQYAQPLSQAVLLLDFRFFDVGLPSSAFDEHRLLVDYNGRENEGLYLNDYLSTIPSKDAFMASIHTVIDNFTNRALNQDILYKDNGFADTTNLVMKYGHHDAFVDKETGYIGNLSQNGLQFYNPETSQSSFDYYRKILQIAYRNDIEFHMAISPNHVREKEIYASVGLWDEYQEWISNLVEINEEEARLAGKSPFPLWDFAGYNKYTTENLPPLQDKTATMQWHWEDSHYKKELGDIVLDNIFGLNMPAEDTIGVLLTSANIDEHLQNIRVDRQHYRDTHLDDIAEVEGLAERLV